jgi:hypothetical protein
MKSERPMHVAIRLPIGQLALALRNLTSAGLLALRRLPGEVNVKGFAMSKRKAVFGRAVAVATLAATMALMAVEPSQARGGRVYRGGGGGAAAAAVAGIVGTGLAIAAAQNSQAYYDGPYDAGPVYYGGGPYYGGGSYDGGYGGPASPYARRTPLSNW